MANQDRKIEAVIFDLDGTLVDSEPVYLEADKQVFSKYGINVDMNFKKKYVGLASRIMLEELRNLYNLSESVDELVAQKNACYLKLAKTKTIVFAEMRKLVKLLKENSYPLAVASGSSKEVIDATLEIAGLRQYFDVTLSSTQVSSGKPAPDVFLAAAKMLKVSPEKCLVVEDSRYGVEAAKHAQMYCIGVPSLTAEPLHECFNTADLLFAKGMDSFAAATVLEWLNKRE